MTSGAISPVNFILIKTITYIFYLFSIKFFLYTKSVSHLPIF
nr:MAG TPA: hypothetical protein [Caudoviricetes sp.]